MLFDGQGPVLTSGFEHSYSITVLKMVPLTGVALMVRDRFWDWVVSIRIQLRVQNAVEKLMLFDGQGPVLRAGFEHSYSITYSKRY